MEVYGLLKPLLNKQGLFSKSTYHNIRISWIVFGWILK
jgi:hypothetical protein